MPETIEPASLSQEARRRYLTYALSVITSRALPDVRDGLKPVQRRILYAMLHDNHLRPDAKHRKSATVVGAVIGRYHPHGDTAVYDAMVRLAQDWSLRLPLVDGAGTLRVRGEYKLEDKKRGGTDLVITSMPYAMTKADLVQKIADVIVSRKLPYLVDVRDESTTDVRIVLEIKKDADPELVMAYLYKHTPLQSSFHVNLTCLVPVPGSPPQPRKLGIKEVLEHFLDFRIETTRK